MDSIPSLCCHCLLTHSAGSAGTLDFYSFSKWQRKIRIQSCYHISLIYQRVCMMETNKLLVSWRKQGMKKSELALFIALATGVTTLQTALSGWWINTIDPTAWCGENEITPSASNSSAPAGLPAATDQEVHPTVGKSSLTKRGVTHPIQKRTRLVWPTFVELNKNSVNGKSWEHVRRHLCYKHHHFLSPVFTQVLESFQPQLSGEALFSWIIYKPHYT